MAITHRFKLFLPLLAQTIFLFCVALIIPNHIHAQTPCLQVSPTSIEPGGSVVATVTGATFNGQPANSSSSVTFFLRSSISGRDINVNLEDGRTTLIVSIDNDGNPIFYNGGQHYIELWHQAGGLGRNNEKICTSVEYVTVSSPSCSINAQVTRNDTGFTVGASVRTEQLAPEQSYTLALDTGLLDTYRHTFTVNGASPWSFFESTYNIGYSGQTFNLFVEQSGSGALGTEGAICLVSVYFDPNAPYGSPEPTSPPPPNEPRNTTPLSDFDLFCSQAGPLFDQCRTCLTNNQIWTALGCISFDSNNRLLADLFTIGISIAGGIALLLILYGAFTISTAASNPQKLQVGRELITAAITGLFLIIFSVVILNFLGIQVLQLPGL